MRIKNLVASSIIRAYKILPKKLQKKSYLVLLSIVFNSVIDLIGIAAIFPLFILILDKSVLEQDNWFSKLNSVLNFESHSSFVIFCACAFLLILILKNVVFIFNRKFQAKFSFDAYEYFTMAMSKDYFQKGFEFFGSENSNDLVKDIVHIPRTFSMTFLVPLMTLISEAFILAIIVFTLAIFYSKIILVLIIVVIPVFALFYSISKNRIKAIDASLNDLVYTTQRNMLDIIFAYNDISILGKYKYFEEKYRVQVKDEVHNRIWSTVYYEMPTKVIEIGVMICIALVFVLSSFYAGGSDNIIETLGVFGLAAFRSVPSLNRIAIGILHVKGKEFTLNLLSKVKYSERHNDKSTSKLVFDKEISIENISYSYQNKENVLSGFSYKINKGDFIGIQGASGSGKTTLINILLRHFQESDGGIFVDGVKLNEANCASWRRLLGIVQQDVFLIDGTIAENIAFGEYAIDSDKIFSIIKDVGLLGYVSSQEKGIHSNVGERGIQMSGGQKQRIGIARALYFNPEILIFDESTSALDSKTEDDILTIVKELNQRGITILFISHKNQTLKICDRILNISEN